jgi:ferredoxin-NADP reductase
MRYLSSSSSASLRDHGDRQNFLLKIHKTAPQRRRDGRIIQCAWGDDVEFQKCTVRVKTNATERGDLYKICVDVDENFTKKFTAAGQFVQMKLAEKDKPAFIAIANGPANAREKKMFEFLVKRPKEGYTDEETGETVASTAQKVCDLTVGDGEEEEKQVLVSEPMGKGFRVPEEGDIGEVLCFAAGSGISPVKSFLEEEGFDNNGAETFLFYGTRDAAHTAFAEELKTTMGGRAKVIHAYSADGKGYAQDYFKRMVDSGELKLKDPKKAIAVLCGQKEMTEQTIEMLENEGVPRERILMNF